MSNDPTRGVDADRTETLPDAARDLFDRLAEEFAERCRRGESPSIADYEARHPEYAAKIRALLPTVALMEQLRRDSPGARDLAAGRPVPERLGEFRVLRELGRGGMGVVYEAVQESLGRHVALKLMHHVLLDAKRLERFRREARAVARLHHTNIVPIFAVGEHDGLPYYAMQFIRGSGLDLLLEAWRGGGASPGEERWRLAATIGVQAAEALEYAHEQGILHRDVKPANLLIDEHQAVWVTDFGLAKLAGHDDLTASGDVIGTLRYLAPEALRGETDRRSDVYSLGLTLYELLTLNPPFGQLSQSELLRRVGEGQPDRPRRLEPAIPRDLETIVLKAIAREPGHRYQTAGALADDLRRFLEDRPIRARRATAPERLWRWARRNRATAALAALAAGSLVLAAAVGWVGYWSTMRELKRADDNVALSLQGFGALFDLLASHDSLPPPPLGQSGRHRPGPGSDDGPPPQGPPGHRPPPGRGGGEDPDGPPPGRGGDPFGPDRGPGGPPPGPPGEARPVDEAALLQSVLTFYERFARQNATDPRLQGEAAWAYRKVGALDERLGRDDEAERAYGRAIAMFEELVAQHPNDRGYRFRLVDTIDMADPWTADPSSLERLERRFFQARELIDRLVAESPDDLDDAQARVHIHAKVAVTLHRLGRLDDARGAYRQALAVNDEAIARWPQNGRLRMDRSTTRQALAKLLLERGRRDEARGLLEAAAAELQSLESAEGMPPPSPDHYQSLADGFRALGEPDRAEAMARRADEVAGPPRGGPPGRDHGGR